MEKLSFKPPLLLVEDGKWLLAVASFETTNSVFKKTVGNNSFSISIPGRRKIPNYLEDGIIEKLKKTTKLRSQNDIELHVEQIRKRRSQIKKNFKRVFLSDFENYLKTI